MPSQLAVMHEQHACLEAHQLLYMSQCPYSSTGQGEELTLADVI